MKDVLWVANSRQAVRRFPKQVRSDLGTELRRVQEGLAPKNWKPIRSVGSGVREIRVKYRGEYRLIYVANFEEGIYALHAFHKKTQRTAHSDIELAKKRLKEVIQQREA
jgi:phage-related protein